MTPAPNPRPAGGPKLTPMLAQYLEALELGLSTRLDESVVEKELRRRQHHRTIDIMLHLLEGLVAAANRTHSAIARQ